MKITITDNSRPSAVIVQSQNVNNSHKTAHAIYHGYIRKNWYVANPKHLSNLITT